MNAEYCPHCGFKNIYMAVAPAFCGGCGQPLNTSTASAPVSKQDVRTVKRVEARRPPVASVPEEGAEERVPILHKLEYEIQGGGAIKMTVGQLMQEQPSEDNPSSRPRSSEKKVKTLTPEEILKESMGVCKSARTKPPQEIE